MKFLALTAALLLSAAPSASIAAEQGAQPETTRDADALSKARAIGTKIRKVKKFYEPQFDISGLESYKPQQQVSGTIRQWG